jgi:hypothetical protein
MGQLNILLDKRNLVLNHLDYQQGVYVINEVVSVVLVCQHENCTCQLHVCLFDQGLGALLFLKVLHFPVE